MHKVLRLSCFPILNRTFYSANVSLMNALLLCVFHGCIICKWPVNLYSVTIFVVVLHPPTVYL